MPRQIVRIVRRFARRNSFEHSATDDDGSRGKLSRSSSTARRPTFFCAGGAVPRDIPQGCMAVYVGREKKRFVISTHFLSHYLFKALLKRSEEEFGFSYGGGLVIACEAVLFEHLLWLIATNDPAARTTELDDLLEFYEF